MLEDRPKTKPFEFKDSGSHHRTTVSDLPPGITKKQSHEAQELARHPEAVEQAKEEARAGGERKSPYCKVCENKEAQKQTELWKEIN